MQELTLKLDPDAEEGTTFVRVYVVDAAGEPIATIEISKNHDDFKADADLFIGVQRWRDMGVDFSCGRGNHTIDWVAEIKRRAAEVAA